MPLPTGYISTQAVRTQTGALVDPIKIVKKTITNPIAKVTNGFSATHLGAAVAGTTSQTLGGSLASGGVGTNATPRNVVIAVTHASAVVAMSGVITGTDQYGSTITEAWSVTAGTTTKTFTGKKAFKTITSITETVAADASGNSIISGSGDVLGLGHYNEVASALKEVVAGAVVTNGVLVAQSAASTADARGTYAPNTVPDAATTYVVYYLTQDLYHVK